jgi:predicted amidohydrolase
MPTGVLVDRYDKRFCAGYESLTVGDLAHYTPGNHFSAVEIRGVRYGVQICHDYRYPDCPNSSARESCWPSFFVRADGVTTGRLRRNVAGVLISTVDPARQFYDSTIAWRARAMDGVLHSGTLVHDPRSEDRTRL